MSYLPSFSAPILSGSLIGPARVPASVTPVLLLSGSMTGRRAASIFNHSSASLYISPKPAVTVNNFYVKLTSGSYFELQNPVYTDEVWGVWDGANGWALMVDFQSSE